MSTHTHGIIFSQLEAPGRTLSFADDVLVYRHGKNRQEIADSVQQELDRIEEWCTEMNGKIHPDKATTLWCSLNNHALKADMPEVSIDGKAIKREHILRYLGIIFDRSLSGKDHVTRIIQKSRKGLTALKTMASLKMPQRVLMILYKALVLSVIEYGQGLLTLSTAQLKRLEVIQNEGMRAILGCTKDTSSEAMRHLLDFPPAAERHKLAQVSAYLKVAADEGHPLHAKIGRQYTSRLKRGKEWMEQAADTISQSISVGQIRKGAMWKEMGEEADQYTHVIATLGRECREWAPGATNAEIESIISEVSGAEDAVCFTDGSVKRGERSGWAYTVRVDGSTVAEKSAAIELTTSSMSMEIKAITELLAFLRDSHIRKAIVVTDSMSTLEKIKKKLLYADWVELINASQLQAITWIFCPGHAGVLGNERADSLAGTAEINNELTLDPPAVMAHVREHLAAHRPPSNSYTLQRLLERNVKAGEGRRSDLRGTARRQHNQLLLETISQTTLRSTLRARGEQAWVCPDCNEPYA